MKQEDHVMPRILIAGANSGCGKTSITCGILQALKKRGCRIQSYKCGPDYIDPMLHGHITGRACRNLDPFFSEREDLAQLVSKDSADADLTVIEGVMGYYDGMGISCEKSTWTVSEATASPTVLIINAKGMSHTIIPILQGLISYRDNPVRGVILNRCSKGLYDLIKPEIESRLGVRVLGYFPYKEGHSIGSRHLGLMTAEEIGNLDEVLARLGETAEECLDLDALLEIAAGADPLPFIPGIPGEKAEGKRARIAVARDKAFCFYYQENLDILEELGADLVSFSPVRDFLLPEDVDGIYLGGGYPESYEKELATNRSMKESIREAVRAGMPIIAECGGFMYTCENLVETDGKSYPMLGLVPTDVKMTGRLSMEFGYVTMTALKDTPFFDKGEQIRAHEFHYSRADRRGDAFRMDKASGKSWQGIYAEDRILAGYPHFYFHNCKKMAGRFVSLAESFRRQRKQ